MEREAGAGMIEELETYKRELERVDITLVETERVSEVSICLSIILIIQ